MNAQRLNEWARHPERLDRDSLYELRTLLARYPYFQTARLLYLKNLYLLHDVTFGDELRKAALYVSDRAQLFVLTENHRPVPALLSSGQSKETTEQDRTLSLIDAFLSTESRQESFQSSGSTPLPTEMATDYASYLLRREEKPSTDSIDPLPMKGQALIDDFIEKAAEEPLLPQLATQMNNPDITQLPSAEETDDESYFTETLAQIYIRQQRYSKALEIIKKLNLKYPKKNAYFADQIRFLEKLIINTKSK